MSTYCISDIHGCFEEFMVMLEKIKFSPDNDTLFILGDAIDRGKNPIDCLRFIMETRNVNFIMGNHEQMMLDYYGSYDVNWFFNGNITTMMQFNALSVSEQKEILEFLKSDPYYKTIHVSDKNYFLSHAGLNPNIPIEKQPRDALLWNRNEFIYHRALEEYIVIFGHTPTLRLHYSRDCSVWFDTKYNDKIDIDCGCVFGGMLACIRLDDMKIYYVESKMKRFL